MRPWTIASGLLAALLPPAAAGLDSGPLGGEPREIELADDISGVALLTTQAGAARTLVVASPEGLTVRSWSGESTARFDRDGARILAWCVAGDERRAQRVYVVNDAGQVLSWDGRGQPEVLLTDKSAQLPVGVYHMQFAQDFDGDGRMDFVLPRADGFQLYFGRDGGVTKGAAVKHRIFIDVDVDDPESIQPSISQRITIPAFRVRDYNGDGVKDLVFRDSDHVQFFWSRRDGTLPEEPTFEIDLEEIRSSLPARSSDLIDTSNLLKVLDSRVTYVSRDFDGDGISDLLLQKGKRVFFYRGDQNGIDRSQATDAKMTSGNLLAAFTFDDDEDGQDDLYMLRVSDISLGQLLLWLVAGGEITFDLFSYEQQAPCRFSRKPSRRRTLNIEVPSVRSMFSDFEGQLEDLAEQFLRVPVHGDLDGDGRMDDVVVASENKLEVYLDVGDDLEEDPEKALFNLVRRFDKETRDGTDHSVKLIELVDWIPLPGQDLRARVSDRTPSYARELSEEDGIDENAVLFLVNADGDATDDVILVWTDEEEQRLRLRLFASIWAASR